MTELPSREHPDLPLALYSLTAGCVALGAGAVGAFIARGAPEWLRDVVAVAAAVAISVSAGLLADHVLPSRRSQATGRVLSLLAHNSQPLQDSKTPDMRA